MNRIIKSLIAVLILAQAACAPEEMPFAPEESVPLSGECDILSFSVGGYDATIDGDRIVFIVKKGYAGNFKFTTRITVSEGASVSPAPQTNMDLSEPVEYTVTAANGNERTYTAEVVRAGEGLYVNGNLLMRDGRPFYAMGVNYFDLLCRASIHKNPSPVGLTGLQQLADRGITVVRCCGSPYYPIEWKESYVADKDAFFAEFDKVIRKAEEVGIGIIPSVFFNSTAIPDLCGENMNQYSNPESKTIEFIRTYTNEVVTRYKDSPAILGWEFANEVGLMIDLPNGQLGVGTETLEYLGQPPFRDPVNDILTQKEMQYAMQVFVEEVRKFDATRPVFTGNAEPRAQAYNNLFFNSWADDSKEQFKYMLELNESSMNTLTIHTYFGQPGKKGSLNVTSAEGWFRLLARFSKEIGKPLFVGEFGVSSTWFPGDLEAEKECFMNMANAMIANKIQLSCAWNFDRLNPEEWSFSTTSRSHFLDMVAESNRRMNE